MKKIIFCFAFLVTFVAHPFAQQVADTLPPPTTIPDLIPVVVGTDTFQLPAKEARVIIDTIKRFTTEHEGNWPTSPTGWIALVITTILGGKLTQVITSTKAVYRYLKPLLKNTLFIVALAAGAVAAGITYGLSQMNGGAFDYTQFTLIWSVCINVGVFIYEKWIKPPTPQPAPTPEPVVTA